MTSNQLRITEEMRKWIEARKRFHLSHAQVQMARELGMNPRKLGSLANHKQEPWKAPLPIFIEQCIACTLAKPSQIALSRSRTEPRRLPRRRPKSANDDNTPRACQRKQPIRRRT